MIVKEIGHATVVSSVNQAGMVFFGRLSTLHETRAPARAAKAPGRVFSCMRNVPTWFPVEIIRQANLLISIERTQLRMSTPCVLRCCQFVNGKLDDLTVPNHEINLNRPGAAHTSYGSSNPTSFRAGFCIGTGKATITSFSPSRQTGSIDRAYNTSSSRLHVSSQTRFDCDGDWGQHFGCSSCAEKHFLTIPLSKASESRTSSVGPRSKYFRHWATEELE